MSSGLSAGLRVRQNLAASFADRLLEETTNRLNTSIERLSSGQRINRAGDDAAGFAVSERLRTSVNGLTQAERNAQDGLSLIQIADGGLAKLTDLLQRIRTLAVQASNDTLTTGDRQLLQVEVNEIVDEVDRQSSSVKFNGNALLTGTFASGKGSLVFQIGADKGDTLTINFATASSQKFGIDGLKVTNPLSATQGGLITRAGAESTIALIQSAIDIVTQQATELGAKQNRLTRIVDFIGIQKENSAAAESRIRDTDFAEEIVTFTKEQILQQTGISALSQANLSPQVVLALLR